MKMRDGWLLANGRRGFTMVEIILVVTIIMILAGIVAPKITHRMSEAKIAMTRIEMSNIKTALQEFEARCDRFPTDSEGLDALVNRPSGISESEYPKPCLEDFPVDAWGNAFRYTCPSAHGKSYDLVSAGPDRKFDTKDDIANWDEPKPKTAQAGPTP